MQRFFQDKIHLHSNEKQEMGKNYRKPSSSRNQSSSRVVHKDMMPIPNQKPNTRIVRIRLVFMRIGDIDTLNEKYQADVYYEARWTETINVNKLKLTAEQQSQLLNENATLRREEKDVTFWTPQLFVENAIGQIGEDKWWMIKRNTNANLEALSPPVVHLDISEHHRIKGLFWEKLELNHFPADVQDLTISITTHHHIEDCELIPDENLPSSINREAFFDQQEWKLYEHVATESRQTKEEYSFQNENMGIQQKEHSVLGFTCRAARRPGYYYWNGFCLIFLITVCSFCIFSIPPDLPQSRLQITCTLLLTSVTFRWVVNRSLPTISYLTTLDKYAIISIIMLVILCVWHSVIASIVFLNPGIASLKSIGPRNVYVNLDRYVFVCMFVIYIILHILLIVWLIFVPYKRRREMEYLDRQYAEKNHIQKITAQVRHKSMQVQPEDLTFRRSSSIQDNLPMMKSPLGTIKRSNNSANIPNASICIPIKEETNESPSSPMEFSEHDDVFYNHPNEMINELKTSQVQPKQNA